MSAPTIDRAKAFRFRVTLACDCQQDFVYGRGPTIAEATALAEKEFRKHNKGRGRGRGARIAERIVEEFKRPFPDTDFMAYVEIDAAGETVR